jgi:hypothetical protein
MAQLESATGSAQAPMLLRRVPQGRLTLAAATAHRRLGHPDETWWELVDATGDDAHRPVGVAVTQPHGRDLPTDIVAMTADGDGEVLTRLVAELVAALRRTDASSLAARLRAPTVVAALEAAGFAAVSTAGAGALPQLLVLAL